MCKYCAYIIDKTERDNLSPAIIGIENGVYYYSVHLNRYEGKFTQDKSLSLLHSVVAEGSKYLVMNQSIEIDYCPFCGEKL